MAFWECQNRCQNKKDRQDCPECREPAVWEPYTALILVLTFVLFGVGMWIGLHGGIN